MRRAPTHFSPLIISARGGFSIMRQRFSGAIFHFIHKKISLRVEILDRNVPCDRRHVSRARFVKLWCWMKNDESLSYCKCKFELIHRRLRERRASERNCVTKLPLTFRHSCGLKHHARSLPSQGPNYSEETRSHRFFFPLHFFSIVQMTFYENEKVAHGFMFGGGGGGILNYFISFIM